MFRSVSKQYRILVYWIGTDRTFLDRADDFLSNIQILVNYECSISGGDQNTTTWNKFDQGNIPVYQAQWVADKKYYSAYSCTISFPRLQKIR